MRVVEQSTPQETLGPGRHVLPILVGETTGYLNVGSQSVGTPQVGERLVLVCRHTTSSHKDLLGGGIRNGGIFLTVSQTPRVKVQPRTERVSLDQERRQTLTQTCTGRDPDHRSLWLGGWRCCCNGI